MALRAVALRHDAATVSGGPGRSRGSIGGRVWRALALSLLFLDQHWRDRGYKGGRVPRALALSSLSLSRASALSHSPESARFPLSLGRCPFLSLSLSLPPLSLSLSLRGSLSPTLPCVLSLPPPTPRRYVRVCGLKAAIHIDDRGIIWLNLSQARTLGMEGGERT